MSSMNALDSALVKLAAASTSLEHHAPKLADVEEARDAAKAAAKILDAAYTLMSCGVYTVAEDPDERKFRDSNDYTILMPVAGEVREEIVAETAPAPVEVPDALPARPEELALFPTWDESQQVEEFDRRLEALAEGLKEHVYPPWEAVWDADPLDAFTRLLVAEAREVKTFEVPTDEERDAWLARFAPAPESEPEPEPGKAAAIAEALGQDQMFAQLMDKLETDGIKESCLKPSKWKKAAKAWNEAYKADRSGTLAKLQRACNAIVITWDIPADVDPFEEGGAE